MKSVTRAKAQRPPAGRKSVRAQTLYGYLFVTPGMLIAAALILYPLLFGIFVSFHQWDWAKGQADSMVFIGLDNYARMLKDPYFWNALKNTVYFATIALVAELCLGLVCALLLHSITRGSLIFRTALIFPLMISDIVAAVVWKMLLDPSTGHINYFLSVLHLPTFNWLTDPKLVIPVVALVETWWNTGVVTLILLSGLQSLPTEPIEMARVDGASGLQIFWHITLPGLRPFIWTAVIFRTIDLLRVFAVVWGTTGGGPARASQVAQHYLYAQGIGSYLNIGYAASLAVTFAIFIGIVVSIYLRFAQGIED
jgi:multiple sugar transport system permease protein